jgi:hypothetical protein
VAFQWRSVLKLMRFMRGFPIFFAARLLCRLKFLAKSSSVPVPNQKSKSLGSLSILSMSWLESLKILGLLFFSGATVTVLLSASRSIHLSLHASPGQ